MADETSTAAGTVETQREFAKNPTDLVKNWLTAIEMAGKEEEPWRTDAEAALKIYRAEQGKAKSYNMLFANTQTKVPALYNSEPAPDIRKRFGKAVPPQPNLDQADPLMQQRMLAYQAAVAQADKEQKDAEQVSEAIERAITIESELYDFDGVMKAAVKDRELQGRGVSRLRVKMGPNGSKSVSCESVIWDDFRHGPAKRWEDVPWIAFRWKMTREELVELDERKGREVTLDVVVGEDTKRKANSEELADIFKRARVWEIWDKGTGDVLFIAESYKKGPIKVENNPYRLREFFPVPKPLYSIESTHTLIPVCEYEVWKSLAEEMNTTTARIAGIVKVMKLRGMYLGSFEKALKRLEDLEDGELTPLEDEGLRIMQQGGLDKAVWMWPVDMAIQVVQGLYEAREQCKQTIYEITGVADILRGATEASETATAQQIKAQWGSLRLQDAQREVQRYARDLYRMMADLMAEVFGPADWTAMTGIQLVPEQMMLLKSDLRREFLIEIETDSTIQADLSRAQQNIAGFVTGLGEFLQSVGPAVQAGAMPVPIAIGFIRVFARKFKLGREADALLDQWEEAIKQQAANPQPQQEDPKVQAEKVKAQAIEVQAQSDMAQTDQQAIRDQQKHGMEMEKLAAETQAEQIRTGLDQQRLASEVQAAHMMPQRPNGSVQ